MRIYTPLLIGILVSGCSGARYQIGGRGSAGGAFAPIGQAGGGTVTSIVYRDAMGPLTRASMLGLGAAIVGSSARYNETSSRVYRYTDSQGRRWKSTVSSGYVSVDAQTAAIGAEVMESAFVEVPAGAEIPIESSLEIASTSLGGDVSGFMWDLTLRSKPAYIAPLVAVSFKGGLGAGRYTFDGMDAEGEPLRHNYIGTPFGFELFHASWLRTFFMADLNWLTFFDLLLIEPPNRSPWRTGLQIDVGRLYARGELAWSRSLADGSSLGLEVGLAF